MRKCITLGGEAIGELEALAARYETLGTSIQLSLPMDADIAQYMNYINGDPSQQVAAAFDKEGSCGLHGGHRGETRRRREVGEPVDRGEHLSGVVHEPGYLRQAANEHLVMRAIRHRVTGRWLDELERPCGMSIARAGCPLA